MVVVAPGEGERLACSLWVFAQAPALAAVVRWARQDRVFEQPRN
jgi:hypothetical protein